MQHKHFLVLALLALILPGFYFDFETGNGIFKDCQQLVVVVSPNNTSIKAQLWRFEKVGNAWKQFGEPHPANLGRKGLAWGKGLHSTKPGLQKKEGDQKSPAGIFRFVLCPEFQ